MVLFLGRENRDRKTMLSYQSYPRLEEVSGMSPFPQHCGPLSCAPAGEHGQLSLSIYSQITEFSLDVPSPLP